jgi:Flp pilus assembly protein TadD
MRLALYTLAALLALGAGTICAADEAEKEPGTRGPELMRQGKTSEAIDEFLKAIDLNPKDTTSRLHLATIYEREGRVDEAAYHYEKVLKVDPRNVTAHNNLGVVYDRKGLSEQARGEFEAALDVDPQNALAAKNLETAKKNQSIREERERQIAAARQAAEAKPEKAGAFYALARTYAFYGDNQQALATLEKAVRLGFNDLAYMKVDAALEGLRNDPNFQRLLARK